MTPCIIAHQASLSTGHVTLGRVKYQDNYMFHLLHVVSRLYKCLKDLPFYEPRYPTGILSRYCNNYQLWMFLNSPIMCKIGIRSDKSLSRVRLFVIPWIAAHQISLTITNSQSSLKFMSVDSVMPSNLLIPCHPLLLLLSIFPSIRVSSNESALQVAKVLEFQLQHPSFWWIFRIDFL